MTPTEATALVAKLRQGITPGPWEAYRNSCYWQFDAPDFGQIGDACASGVVLEGQDPVAIEAIAAANARLIAAAPELLDAVEALAARVAELEARPGIGHALMAIKAVPMFTLPSEEFQRGMAAAFGAVAQLAADPK